MAGIPRPRPHLLAASAALWLGGSATAQAGMTSFVLTDIAKARLDVLSFFVLVYFLLAWAVKGLWNHLAKGFPKLPRISYGRAFSLLLIAGLFMYVILTMISGARELLTPGAWTKTGIHYELKGAQLSGESARRSNIERLKAELWRYADAHEGKLPDNPFDDAIPKEIWHLPGGIGTYNYLPGRTSDGGRVLVAYEPTQAAEKGARFVLLSDGAVESWTDEQIAEAIATE